MALPGIARMGLFGISLYGAVTVILLGVFVLVFVALVVIPKASPAGSSDTRANVSILIFTTLFTVWLGVCFIGQLQDKKASVPAQLVALGMGVFILVFVSIMAFVGPSGAGKKTDTPTDTGYDDESPLQGADEMAPEEPLLTGGQEGNGAYL
ncbi:unnamed protein product [Vitrella brassicaformis CCMP3155]|uniref:Uncharacterized protein n=2 Tax=Vitrella brassicaformis TaxID=1169539 RepID=A0A0G4H6F8_VITBC|nr:unnamed protein product [Vitrella brassicaformis CCMP3155]|eukprot:CEM39199.1 unnamed protein product [Vitrella brassicaformis CCMP3155]